MITEIFRPWGRLDWILNFFPSKEWSLFGSIATGDRSLSAWQYLIENERLYFTKMLQIADKTTPFWGTEPHERIASRRRQYLTSGGNINEIIECDIRDNFIEIIDNTSRFLEGSNENIIIDISTFPKKFFFPIIREVLHKSKSKSILVSYTKPLKYDRKRPLAIDPDPWKSIPGFHELYNNSGKPLLIVGLGIEPLGLPQIIRNGEYPLDRILFFFPFPANPSGYIKNWEFLRNLDSEVGKLSEEPLRLNPYDVPMIYNSILSHTDNGKENVVFAPYGPKPMSLSMCLYACKFSESSAVYYTQPASYNPHYSSGVKMVDNVPETITYCIRINGRDIY